MGEWIAGATRGRAIVAGVLCAALVGAGGCGGKSTGSTSGKAPAHTKDVAQTRNDQYSYARARFNEMCAGCHTLADAGAHGPRYNLDRVPEITKPLVRFVIREGEPGMPAWDTILSRREFEELVAYVFDVAKRQDGETYWQWQAQLRGEGTIHPPILPGTRK